MQPQALTQFDPSRFFQLPRTDPQAGRTINAQVGAIHASTDFSGKMSVVTAEGDKVTFSLNAETDFRYTNYQYKVQSSDASLDVKGESAESSMSQTMGLAVEGNLNDQEVADLTKLFASVTNIFRKFFRGQDEQALAKTANLAEGFGDFSSLGGLDLSVDVTRSVMVVAAQLAAEQAAEPAALPSAQAEGTMGLLTSQQDTPGGAPTAVAAIPPPSIGITAPTQPSIVSFGAASTDGTHLSAPAQETQKLPSLVQQVLDALEGTNVDSRKVGKHLPDLLTKLREDVRHELRAARTEKQQSTTDVPSPTTNSNALFAYRSTSQILVPLSIRT